MNYKKSRCISALLCLLILSACNHRMEQTKEGQLILRAEKVMAQQPDSALVWLRSIEKPQDLPKSQQADYYLLLGMAIEKTTTGMFQDSLATGLSTSIDYFLQRKDDEKTAWAYFLRNRAFYDSDRGIGDANKAMQDCLEAKKYADNIGDETLLAQIYRDMGNIYYDRHLYEEALDNYGKSNRHLSDFKNKRQLWSEMLLYGKMGSAYNNLQQYDSALVYQQKALDYALAVGDTASDHVKSVIASLYKNIGFSNKKKGDINAEKDALLQAWHYTPKTREAGMNIIIYSLSLSYLHLQQLDSAAYYAGQFTDEADETTREKALKAHHWYNLHKAMGNYPLSLENLEAFVVASNAIFEEELSSSVLEVKKKYEKEVLENEYNQVVVQRLYLIIGVIALILLGVIVTWFFRNRVKRRERELQEAEQALLAFKGMLEARDNQLEVVGQTLTERDKQLQALLVERDEKSEQLRAVLADRLDIARRMTRMNVVPTGNTQEFMKQFHKVFGKNLLDWEHIYPVINDLYDGFVDKIKMAYPGLGPKDLQLCCFIRAGFRNEELAVLLGYTQSSVRVKKVQLAKKMGFSDAETFLPYLMSV